MRLLAKEVIVINKCPYDEMKCSECPCFKGRNRPITCDEGHYKSWRKSTRAEKTVCELEIPCRECEYNYSTRKCRLNKYKLKLKSKRADAVTTLCSTCIRSAAPPELQCIWDASGARRLPEGAKVEIRDGAVSQDGYAKVIIISCPLYLSMYEEKNRILLKRARNRR